MIPTAKPSLPVETIDDVMSDVRKILESGRLILGPYTERFEQAFAGSTGRAYAVALSSATAGLEIALRYYGVREGRRVVTSANNFIAVPNAIARTGAAPEFVDISIDTWSAEPWLVHNAMMASPRPAALVLVHVAGIIDPSIDALTESAHHHGVPVIADCSHAHGGFVYDKSIGAYGDCAVFSLYPSKTLTACVGGMLVTDDPQLALFARSLRHHGAKAGTDLSQIVTHGGADYLMSEVHAAIGLAHFQWLSYYVERRRTAVMRYRARLMGHVGLPLDVPDIEAVLYKFPVHFASVEQRERVQAELRAQKIEVGPLYNPPVYEHPGPWKVHRAQCPVADEMLPRQLALPLHASLTHAQIDFVCDTLIKALP